MKKITIVTMQLKTPGGIERFVTTLATMLSDSYSIEIVANYGKPEDKLAFPLPKGIKLTFLSPIQPQEISMKNIITTFKWHQIPAELARRIEITTTQNRVFKDHFSNLETDFIITDRALYSTLVSKYYHGPAKKIATDHNYHQNNPKYIKELSDSIKGFDALVVATDELASYYQKAFRGIQCYHIPNALNNIPEKKSPLNTNNLVAVGRFVPEKDFSTLIDIMSLVHQKNPTVHLTIIGDGLEMALIKSKIKAHHLEKVISLPGWLPQSEIKKYYYDSSLFVMTSKTEAFGLALTEAMSHGLPCIAFSRAQGATAQLSNNIGFLIQDDNLEAMSDKILSLLDNKAILKKQQSVINKTIQKYSPETIQKSWLSLLSAI